ncbi:MAG: DNA topoisomerase IV subunit A, partial [Rickettsiales bacterium]|nr:DNA topoisomerase IV subunit A [Rickettsiales bacterium]
GKFYTLPSDKLPRGKGHGEPIRLMLDMDNDAEIVSVSIYDAEAKLLVASSAGKGFIVEASEVMAQTRNGKQVLNVTDGHKAMICVPVEGDHVAIIGDNRKLLIFPQSQIPPMKRGQGVTLQKYKDGGLSDLKTFALKEGLSWALGGKTRTEMDLKPWLGNRADAGRLPPTGFPRSNNFTEG